MLCPQDYLDKRRDLLSYFFFNDTATTEIYTLSLHDALPISSGSANWWRKQTSCGCHRDTKRAPSRSLKRRWSGSPLRSGKHKSELQSRPPLVCPLLL